MHYGKTLFHTDALCITGFTVPQAQYADEALRKTLRQRRSDRETAIYDEGGNGTDMEEEAINNLPCRGS